MAGGNFPVGTGVMSVIPIESAIEGETRRASYEEISNILMKHECFLCFRLCMPYIHEKSLEKAVDT